MHTTDRIQTPQVRGRIGLWKIHEPGREGRKRCRAELLNGLDASLKFDWGPGGPRVVEPISFKSNQIQYEWGAIAAQCIGKGNRNYRINALYIEFENVINPSDVVTVPTWGRDEGRDYYQDLAVSASRDFLRVPLSFEPTIGIEAGFEDSFIAGVTGNKLTFYTQTQGTSGFHGKAFTNAANSKVFGAALIATPEFADPTKDLIFARTYFDGPDQTVKELSSQVGITWEMSFE